MPDTVQDLIRKAATEAGVPTALALAVAEQESSFNPTLINPKKVKTAAGEEQAVGTFQLLPSTAKGLGVDPMDPRQNIAGGVKYLRQLLDQHQGDLSKVLGEYGGVVRDTKYVPSVLTRLEKFKIEKAPVVPVAEQSRPSDIGALGALRGSTAIGPAPPWYAEYDPTTTRGRVGLAGTTAGILAGLATRHPVIAAAARTSVTTAAATAARTGVAPWLIRTLGPPVAAAVAGGAEAGAEVGLGTAPPGTSPVSEGLWQGGYEAFGQTVFWPIRRAGGAFLGTRVGRQAAEALTQRVEAMRVTGRTAVAAVRQRVQQGLDAARTVAEATKDAAAVQGRQIVRAVKQAGRAEMGEVHRLAGQQARQARETATALLADTELANADAVSQLTRQYDNLLAQPPDPLTPGALTREAVQGPAKRALDMAGQRVAEAAADGPVIALTPIKAALDDMASKARPAALFPAKEQPKGIGFLTGVAPGRVGAAASTRMSREEFQKFMAQQLGVEETHPLSGILGQIQQAPESLSFADAHKLKMLLDEAVNWETPAKKHLQKITKGLRTVVRDALSVHEQYNVATAAYEAMVPLYRKGVGKSIITAASTPGGADKIARSLSPKNTAGALALKDLLVTQSAAGGDAATGQQAWDAVRSAFTYNHVIKGGLDGLSDRVHQLVEQSPAFAKAVFDDLPAQKILTNLDQLGQQQVALIDRAAAAMTAAKVTGQQLTEAARTVTREEVTAARARGATAVDIAQEAKARLTSTTRDLVREHMTALRRASDTEITEAAAGAKGAVLGAQQTRRAFQKSTVGQARTAAMQFADAFRAFGLGPTSIWGLLSFLRLTLSTEAPDIIRWAAYSDQTTQRLVRLFEGTLPERAVVVLVRSAAAVANPRTDVSQLVPPGGSAAPEPQEAVR